MASTQEAIVLQEVGKPLIKVTRPIPTPQAHEVLVKITVAGINPHDHKIRDTGLFNIQPGGVLAADVVGVVAALGSDVHTIDIGDRLVFMSDMGHPEFTSDQARPDTGALQQYAVIEEGLASHIPYKITNDEAATLPVNLFAPFAALFSTKGLGIPPPFENNPEAKTFDYAGSSIVIIGGGSSTGKFGVQLAALAGVGKIIAVASTSSAAELKSYGATHIVDRHQGVKEIETKIREIVGDDLIYVFDSIAEEHTLAVSILSSTKKGIVATLLPGPVDATKIGEKKEGYEIPQTFGSPHFHGEFGRQFWAALPHWLETRKIKPLGYKVVEGGLSVDGVNKVLDDYRDGKSGKYHVHPTEG